MATGSGVDATTGVSTSTTASQITEKELQRDDEDLRSSGEGKEGDGENTARLSPSRAGEDAESHIAPGIITTTSKNEKSEGIHVTENRDIENEQGDGEPDGADPNIVYPTGPTLWLLSLGLCLATFVQALDNSILATAIPKITSDFNSLGDVGWYGSSYLLTTTALQPLFGRIYTYFNVKYTYIIAIFLFELGSVVCAAAKNSVMLIVGRAIAGAGGSALFSGGLTIVGFAVPLHKRPVYIAILSSMFGISSIVGPLLGGVFTDRVSWRWCFWINLPFGGAAVAAVWFFFTPPPRTYTGMSIKQKILEIDLVGAFFLMASIVCLLLALQWGGTTYAWTDSKVWGCFLGFGLLIAVFIAQQFRRGDRGTIPPRIMGKRTVLFSSLFSCFLSMAVYAHIFYLPFFFQAVKGTTAEGSGIRSIPYLLSNILAALVVGAGITILGWYKPFMIAGTIVFTIGAGLIYTFQVDTDTGKWIGYQLIAGLGAGAGIQIPFVAIQVVLNAKDMPTGNSLAIFFNTLGGAVSISIAQNIFQNGLYQNMPKFAPNVSAEAVIKAGATYLRQLIPPADLPGVLQAYMASLDQAFVLSIACGGLAVIFACFVENKSVKGHKLAPGGGA